MSKKTKRLWAYLASFTCLILAAGCIYWTFQDSEANTQEKKISKINSYRFQISEKIGPHLLHNELIPQIELTKQTGETETVNLNYTIDPNLQKISENLLKSYKPDYGSIVMMDASTGKILALSSFEKGDKDAPNLALRGTFPAASVFKIITASAALDKYDLNPNTRINFNGGNHTLYKKNIMSTKVNRWTRNMTLREAFARSINAVFGRIALDTLNPSDLVEYADRFGFNRFIASDMPFEQGKTDIPGEKGFHLAEMASGFNKITTMSPVQGALIASAIAEDGVMHVPYIVDKITDLKGNTIFQSEPIVSMIAMTPEGAEKVQELMEATITQGTSRKSFRSLVKDKKLKELVLGGKTGSLTGTNPKGKVDWFVGYAMNDDQKIAIAALTVNVKNWVVKSSYLAQTLLKSHFKEQFSKENEKFFTRAPAQTEGL